MISKSPLDNVNLIRNNLADILLYFGMQYHSVKPINYTNEPQLVETKNLLIY